MANGKATDNTTSTTPPTLKAFEFLGVDFNEIKPSSSQAWGTCPFCSTEGKFAVNTTNTKWDCKVCSISGNLTSFMSHLWDVSKAMTEGEEDAFKPLLEHRNILFPDTFKRWGVCKSIITEEWLIPAFNLRGNLHQLYRYINVTNPKGEWSYKLIPTPGVHEEGRAHGIFGYTTELVFGKHKKVYVCEGPWDGMAFEEVMSRVSNGTPGKYTVTGNRGKSLLGNDGCVIATPGANVFLTLWAKVLEGKDVVILYDNDHPKINRVSKKSIIGAGYGGTKRVVQMLSRHESKPKSVCWLHWGLNGSGKGTDGGKPKSAPYYDKNLPSGYDVRDAITKGLRHYSNDSSNGETTPTITPLSSRKDSLVSLLSLVKPIPSVWVTGTVPTLANGKPRSGTTEDGQVVIEPIKCENWNILVNEWRKAMRWTEGLDRALSVMLACITSTRAVGDQLWLKVIAPPSSGKSVLCEALSVARQYVFAKSTIRGFFSGYQSDKDGSEDNSLISRINGKTFITKDADTLLQSSNLPVILSQARDIYDRNTRTSYGNKTSRDYENLSMTWIICGTAAIRQLDTSELGARFIDCVIMDSIDDELEDEILERVAHRAFRNMKLEINGKAETHVDPCRVRAMQLTGGYVEYLRKNALALLTKVHIQPHALRECMRLGKFVAYMRARPSVKQDETAEREMGGRLVEQFVRLATCTAVVLGRPEVDEEVMRRVKRCAFDTARGKTLDIATQLYRAGRRGLDNGSLALLTNESPQKQISILRFLRKIGALDIHTPLTLAGTRSGKQRWQLTESVARLYADVHGLGY